VSANSWFQSSSSKAECPLQVQAREHTLLATAQPSPEAWLKNVHAKRSVSFEKSFSFLLGYWNSQHTLFPVYLCLPATSRPNSDCVELYSPHTGKVFLFDLLALTFFSN